MNLPFPKNPVHSGSSSGSTGLGYPCFHKLFMIMLLMSMITGTQTARSQTNAYSANFQSLLSQIQGMYCQPNGYDFTRIRSSYPVSFATILGHALRQQLIQTQNNPGLRPAYDQLQQEARTYFTESFRQYQYHFDNGQPMQEESLWQFVQNGINGLNDEAVLRDFRVVQGSMPMVLATDAGSGTNGGISAGKVAINKPKEKNAIILLGVEAPEVKEEKPSSFELDNPAPASTENSFELNK
jgi:hypothetical protein